MNRGEGTEAHAPPLLFLMHPAFSNGLNPGSLLLACWQGEGVKRHSSTGDEAPAVGPISNAQGAAAQAELPAPLLELLKRVAVTARVALLASPVRALPSSHCLERLGSTQSPGFALKILHPIPQSTRDAAMLTAHQATHQEHDVPAVPDVFLKLTTSIFSHPGLAR